MSETIQPIKLIGRAYVKEAEAEDNPDAYLCIDSEQVRGVVFGFFAKSDLANARLAAAALNLWAGFDAEEVETPRPKLIKN